jgi:hypothetical protein
MNAKTAAAFVFYSTVIIFDTAFFLSRSLFREMNKPLNGRCAYCVRKAH